MEEILNKYKNHRACEVPEGYFDSLPEQVMSRIAEEDTQVAAMLEAHRNNEGYAVPEGYFEKLPAEVSARMAAEGSRRTLVLRRRLIRIASVAACAGLLMGTGIYVFNMLNDPEITTGKKVAHVKGTPPAPVQGTQNTLDLDKALAYTETSAAPAAKPQYAVQAQSVADAATDQFISENLDENDLDEVDFDILDFYSDDMAASDMWGF